jgi:hypothetical protein
LQLGLLLQLCCSFSTVSPLLIASALTAWLMSPALQLLNDGLTFAGAMLLNLLVQHLEQATATASPAAAAAAAASASNSTTPYSTGVNVSYPAANISSSSGIKSWLLLPGWLPAPGRLYWGFVLAGLLGLSAVAKAVIGSHYNYGLSMVTVR